MRMRLSTLIMAMLCIQLGWSQTTFSVEGADTGAFNPIDLIENICLGPGIQIIDIEYQGDPAAVGRFYGGGPYVDIGEGFLMTTGHAANLSGGAGADNYSQVTASVSNDSQVPYFPELAALANSTDMHDLSVYNITFVPTGDSVLFRYAFASEEYPEFVCSNFNDAFAFFLEGPDADGNVVSRNLAQIPETGLPVSINSVNGGIPGSHPSVSLFYCNELQNGSLDYAAFFNAVPPFTYPTYNGYTDVFEAKAAVTPCEEYTMTLAIADFGDALWDSAIFFEAESFCSTPGPGIDTLPIVLEACAPLSVPINLEYFPETEFPLAYFVSGTAEAGVDYFGLNGAGGFIQDATDVWQLFLPVLDEGEDEGIETIEIRVFGSNCLEQTYVIPIADRVSIEGPEGGTCSTDPIDLQVVGDPAVLEQFEFEWSTGETGTSISVIPDEPTTYFLTYTNELATCSATYNLEISDPEADVELELCNNEDGIEVNGTLYNFDNPSGTEVLEGASIAGCDSIVNIQIVPQVQAAFFPEVCQNETIIINGTEYGRDNPSGIEILSGAAANGCDSVVRINLVPLEVPMGQLREEICDNEAIEVNGTIYNKNNPEGTEIFSGAAANGCDSIVEVQLEILSTYETELNEQIPEGDAYSLGGQEFTASGMYPVVLSAANGCDSTVTLNLRVNTTTSTLTDSIAIGQSENICVNTNIFQSLASFDNLCPQTLPGTEFLLDDSLGCIDYTGISVGIDTACLLACDDLGICDTTYLAVSVFENLLAAVDDYDTTLYNQPITIDVLANDWTSETVVDTQYLVSGPEYGMAILNSDGTIDYTPELNACLLTDQLSYAICNATGCDTAQVYIYLDDTSGLCSGVWPGDVNNDGIVNQIDHWAVGLAYGENGPVRPNASFEWVAQPAIDWNGTFTFIQEINLKYADCNGTGQINTDDVGPIYVNWGLTHMAPYNNPFPYRAIPVESERIGQGDQVSYELRLGDNEYPMAGAYGLGFAISFDPERVENLVFDAVNSIYGVDGDNLMVLEKIDLESGYGYISLVRNDHQPVEDFGKIGELQAYCPSGDCGLISISELQLLQLDGDVFNIPGTLELNANPVSTQELSSQSKLHLFPNPVKELLQVMSTEGGGYQLYSSRGELVQQGRLNVGRNELRLDNVVPGLYLLQARVGEELLVRKLVVQ